MLKFLKKFSTITIFFIVFTLFVTISTSVLILSTWHEIKHKASLELRYSNRMIERTFTEQLHQHEVLIDLLGKELHEIGVTNHPRQAGQIIKKLLDVEKNLVGFTIRDSKGDLLFSSFTTKTNTTQDAHNTSKIEKTIQKTLHRKRLTLGDVKYKQSIHKWIIPIYLPIYDRQGKVVFIISAGIDLLGKTFPWKLDMFNTGISHLFVKYNHSPLYVSGLADTKVKDIYGHPLAPSLLQQIHINGISTAKGPLISKQKNDTCRYLLYSSQNAHYQFITITQIPYKKLLHELYEQLIYFILGIMLFYLIALVAYFIINKREKEHEKKLQWIANHDSLTSLPNKYFIQQKIAKWNKQHPVYSILLMDINDFKSINDNYGHPFGDKMLMVISQRLREIIQSCEILARQGGDEFIILTVHPLGDIATLAQRITEEVSRPLVIDNITLYPKLTMGLARYPLDSQDMHTLLSQAGMALHEAKKEKIYFLQYSKKLDEISKHRMEIGMELRKAVQAGELYVLLQPQINAKTLQISGVEALVRWNSPKLGLIPPDQFIQIAEEIGEITNIGRFVLEKACKACQEVYKQTGVEFTLSINASVVELLTEGYLESVLEIVNKSGFAKEQLLIEITESLFIHDIAQAKQILSQLRREGIGISLDDFGTGYSSLSTLKDLPVTELKIDQSFIFDLLKDDSSLQITRSIIALAKIFHLHTVAEGVEEKEHLYALQEAGCTILQGYYFAKPLTCKELIDFIGKDVHKV